MADLAADPFAVPPKVDPNDPTQSVQVLSVPFCNVTLALDLFRPSLFLASRRLETTNRAAIRWGGSNDMMTLLSGTQEDQEKYIQGLLASSLVMAVFFFCWCIIMLLFKCMGHTRCGFFCGRFVRKPSPPPPPPLAENGDIPAALAAKEQPVTLNNADLDNHPEGKNPEEENGDDGLETPVNKNKELDEFVLEHQAWTDSCRKQEVRLLRTRVVLVSSCFCISLCAILFCVYGTKYVSQTLIAVENTLRHLQRLLLGGVVVLDNFAIRQQEAAEQIRQNSEMVSGLCPNLRPQLCQELESGTNANTSNDVVQICNFTGVPFVESTLQTFADEVYEKNDILMDELTDARNDVLDLYNKLETILEKQYNLEWAFWIAFAFAMSLIFCCIVIVWGIYRAHQGRLTKFQKLIRHHVLFPIFCVLVLLSFVFAFLFTIAAVATSDWCINTPDQKVSFLLDKTIGSDGESSTVILDFANFYVNQCNSALHPAQLKTQSTNLLDLMGTLSDFFEQLESIDLQQWQSVCGSDTGLLRFFGSVMAETICLLSNTLQDVTRFMWCRQWNPLYTSLMYDGVCFDAQSGLLWVASTMFGIVVFAFLVLLLRAGAFDIEEEGEYLRNARRLRVLCYNTMTCAPCQRANRTSVDACPTHDSGLEPSTDTIQRPAESAARDPNFGSRPHSSGGSVTPGDREYFEDEVGRGVDPSFRKGETVNV